MAYPSTFADIQNAVIAKARLDAANAADVSKVKDWINQAQARVCLETECLQDSDTIQLTANAADYTLPAAIARIKYMTSRQVNQGGYNAPLLLVPVMKILQWRQAAGGMSVNNGTVSYYALSGLADLLLYPTPTTADTLLVYYVRMPNVLTNAGDISEIPEPYGSKLLEYGALLEASDYLKDIIASYTYPQQMDDWMSRFRQHLRRREGAQTKVFEKFMGGLPPHDPSVDVRGYEYA